jgi:hypothetical protein
MRALASAVALIIAALGVLGVVSPTLLLELARPLLSPVALYVVAAVRVAFGVVLWFAASGARMPRALRILSIFIVAAGAFTPFFGVERSQAVFDWWSQQPPWFMRAWASLPIILGCFLFLALRPREQAAA